MSVCRTVGRCVCQYNPTDDTVYTSPTPTAESLRVTLLTSCCAIRKHGFQFRASHHPSMCVCVWERDSEKGGGGRERVGGGGGGGKGHWSVSEWSVSLVSPSEGKHPAEDSVEMNSMRRWVFDPMSVLTPPSPLSWLTDTDYILPAMSHFPSVITSPEHFLNSTLVRPSINGWGIPRLKCQITISPVYFLSVRFHP